MRLKFVTIGQNLRWPRGRLSLARKKKKREFITLALARVKRYLLRTAVMFCVKQLRAYSPDLRLNKTVRMDIDLHVNVGMTFKYYY